MNDPSESNKSDGTLKPSLISHFSAKSVVETIKTSDRASVISLLVANFVPILMAIVFRWDVAGVVMFYWFENLIVGFYAILRMAFAKGDGLGEIEMKGVGTTKFFLIPFFTAHYGIFCLVHGSFIFMFAGLSRSGGFFGSSSIESDFNPFSAALESLDIGVVISLLFLLASHGISFKRNYIDRGEYKQAHPILEMFRPYKRIVLLHVCIIFGGILTFLLGSFMPLVILLMVGKTLLDLALHSVSHRASAA